jgi:hypothetical protein
MAGETTTPLLPCTTLEEISAFYEALGFRTTYRQRRPNGYAIMVREDLELHFFSMDDFVPADSYGSCLVGVPDADAFYAALRAGLRARYGSVPVTGIPRLTRPRKRQQRVVGFSLIDPGGNWIRVHEHARAADVAETVPSREPGQSALAAALVAAATLGDSKGDLREAARVIDSALSRAAAAPAADRIAALVYRAELALGLGDRTGAAQLLDRVGGIPLDEATRSALADDFARADDLRRALADAG